MFQKKNNLYQFKHNLAKSLLHNQSGRYRPLSLRSTFQRQVIDLEEDEYFFLTIKLIL